MFEILQSLYWAIYGLVDLDHAELEEPHEFTEYIGKLIFGSYSLIAFVVLLNLLIAMMSNSYQNISVSTDKFSLFQFIRNFTEPLLVDLSHSELKQGQHTFTAFIRKLMLGSDKFSLFQFIRNFTEPLLEYLWLGGFEPFRA